MASDRRASTLYQRFRNLVNTGTVGAQASALVAGKWGQDAFRFVLLLCLARTSPSGFGLFIFGAGVAALIRAFLALGFEQFTIRELAGDPEASGIVLGQMLRLKTLIGFLLLGGIGVLGWLQGWNRTETLVVLIVSAGKILDSAADTLFSLYRYAGHQVQEAACSLKAALVGALYGSAALLAGGGIAAVSLFVVVSSGLKVILAAALGMRTGLLPQLRGKGPLLPSGSISALWMIGALSFWGSFYNQVPVLLLKHFKALGDLAVYGVATELAGGLATMVSTLVIGGVLYPTLARTAAQDSAQFAVFMQTYFWRLAAFGLGIAFFFLTLGRDLLLLIYGGQYAGSVIPLQILGLAILFSFVNNFLVHAFLAQHRERMLLWFHLAPACLSLALGLFLIPRLGASGAALSLLACRGILTCLVLVAAQRRYGILSRAQMGAFLGGGLILGTTYCGLPAVGLTSPCFLAGLALLGYAWWTWRWTLSPGNLLEGRS